MMWHPQRFPSRLHLIFLIACAGALAVDMITGVAGVLQAIVLIKLGISAVKIPSLDLVLISMSRWRLQERLVLAGVAFLVGLALATAWVKPRTAENLPDASRAELSFLIACAVGLVSDLIAVAATEFVGMAMRAEMERPRIIPHYELVLLSIGSWLFEYRMVLVPAIFVLTFVLAAIVLKPRRVP